MCMCVCVCLHVSVPVNVCVVDFEWVLEATIENLSFLNCFYANSIFIVNVQCFVIHISIY